MALTDDDIFRIKYELGYHTLTVNAEPYISYVSVFQVIIKNFISGAGEAIVRDFLDKIDSVRNAMDVGAGGAGGAFALASGGLKKVDEIEFYPSGAPNAPFAVANGGTQFANLRFQLDHWRNELASALGVPNGWAAQSHGSARSSVY